VSIGLGLLASLASSPVTPKHNNKYSDISLIGGWLGRLRRINLYHWWQLGTYMDSIIGFASIEVDVARGNIESC